MDSTTFTTILEWGSELTIIIVATLWTIRTISHAGRP